MLYLPPYSSDFSPIEQVFAKTKALLRTVAARAANDLTITIQDAFTVFKPNECCNNLIAAGYGAYEPTNPSTALAFVLMNRMQAWTDPFERERFSPDHGSRLRWHP